MRRTFSGEGTGALGWGRGSRCGQGERASCLQAHDSLGGPYGCSAASVAQSKATCLGPRWVFPVPEIDRLVLEVGGWERADLKQGSSLRLRHEGLTVGHSQQLQKQVLS